MSAELEILSSFFPLPFKAYTTMDVEKRSGYSHERVHTILSKLEKEGKIKKRTFGRTNVYNLRISPDLFLAYVYFNDQRRKAAKLDAMSEKTCIIFAGDRKKQISASNETDLKKLLSDEFIENAVVLCGFELFFSCAYLNRKDHDELSI